MRPTVPNASGPRAAGKVCPPILIPTHGIAHPAGCILPHGWHHAVQQQHLLPSSQVLWPHLHLQLNPNAY